MKIVTIHQNDTARPFTDTFTVDGEPLDLTGASITLVWKNRDTGTVTRRTATADVPTSGSVVYNLVAEDTATAGRFLLEWEIALQDTTTINIPTEEPIYLFIKPELS